MQPPSQSITDWTRVGCADLQGYTGARICLDYSPGTAGAARGILFNDSQSAIPNKGIFVNLGSGADVSCSQVVTPAGDRVQCVKTLNGRFALRLNYTKGSGAPDSVQTAAHTF
ncbi:hypothetical protein [Nocardioides plantarum]|uniref:hypothetical protein n=1 Tax=Nocardioides plantarum TaxID=29299 RepID=UPI00360B4E6D